MMRLFRVMLTALLCLAAGTPALAQLVNPAIGLWGIELSLGPKLRDDLVVRRQGSQWTASLAGQRTNFIGTPGNIRFQFAGGDGFRGRETGKAIEGFWLQPNGGTEDARDPGGSGQRFATPLTLRATVPNEWRGAVAPLDRKFTLWLSVFRAQDGALIGAFRNPEANSNGGASRFQITQNGDVLHFLFKSERGEITHDAQLLRNPDRIRLNWPDLNQSIDLARRNPAQAVSFYPRLSGEKAYAYTRPTASGDGWRTARAADTGISEEVLSKIVGEIAASDPTTRPPQLMHSLLVAHHGRLVLEEYFFGYGRDVPHDMRSAGKTFGSVLLGTTPARRAGLTPESRIYEVLKARGPFAQSDPRKARITLSHLMTHTSGLACNDNDDDSPGNENTMQTQSGQPDWWRYTMDLPMAHEPGSRYAYCSANSNLVGAALTEATATWLPLLFRKQVAEPLQFGRWHWNLMPSGEGYLGGGAFLRPRDLLKVGQMYLDGGVWNGRRIVPQTWVKTSIRPIVEISPASTGLTEAEFGNFYGRGEDSLAWHLGSLKSGVRDYPTYAATGNGGQVLIVVPDLDLVVVLTGGNYGQGRVWTRWGQQIVGDKIIPAIMR